MKITVDQSGDGPVIVNGYEIGYVSEYRLYLHGQYVGEYSTYVELIHMIREYLA